MREKIKHGSITVEASFVVPLTIIVIVAVAYLCIYMCDTAIAAGVLDRHLNRARLDLINSQTEISNLKGQIEEELNNSLIGASNMAVEIQMSNNAIQSRCSGSVKIPLGWRTELKFAIENKTSRYKPVAFIRNIRRVVEAV